MPVVHKLPPTDELMEEYNIVKEKLLAEGKKRGAISFLARKYNVHNTSISDAIKRSMRKEEKNQERKESQIEHKDVYEIIWRANFEKNWNEISHRLLSKKKIIIMKKSTVKYIPKEEIPRGYIY